MASSSESVRGVAKRTFTPANILKTTANLVISMPVIIRSVFSPRTSKALREKVMLGVTTINDSRYCAWGHSHWATSQGVSPERISQILGSRDHSPEGNRSRRSGGHSLWPKLCPASGRDRSRLGEEPPRVLQPGRGEGDRRVRLLHHVHEPQRQHRGSRSRSSSRQGSPDHRLRGCRRNRSRPVLLVLVSLVALGKLVGTDTRRAKRHRASQDGPQDGGNATAK